LRLSQLTGIGLVEDKEVNVKKGQLIEKIKILKKKRNAVILSHVYQRDEVQDIADFVGDSLGLSRKAVSTDAEVIVFCGVRFMAETAAILNPDKIVLSPDENAGCALADMATLKKLRAKKEKYPNATIVSYVNSSALIKAESDICCTSANAVDVVNSLKEKEVLFLPDKNLGKFVASKTDKNIILWEGFCYVHHNNIVQDDIKRAKVKYPNAKVMVHPECPPEVTSLADYVGSTAQMAKYASRNNSKEFIVGTENGMLHNLKTHNPDKKFYPASENAVCKDMKLITLEKVASALENMRYQVKVPEEIATRARRALDKMLEIKIS